MVTRVESVTRLISDRTFREQNLAGLENIEPILLNRFMVVNVWSDKSQAKYHGA